MAQEIYNDVTVAWTPRGEGAVTIHHTQVAIDDGAAEVPTTDATDSEHTYLDGIADPSVQVTHSGSGDGVDLAAEGALAIANMDGSLSNAVVVEDSVEGAEDVQITGSFTVVACPAA